MKDRHCNTLERSTRDNNSNDKPKIYEFSQVAVITHDIPHEDLTQMARRFGSVNVRKAGSI